MNETFRFARTSTPVTLGVLLFAGAFLALVVVRDLLRLASGTGSISTLILEAAILLLIGRWCFLYAGRNIGFHVSQSGLRISGDFRYGRGVPGSDLVTEEIRAADLDLDTQFRPGRGSNGIRLPGYARGWFELNNGKKALVFVGDKHRVVYVPTKAGYVLLLSVRKPIEFVASLRSSFGPAT